MEVPPELPCILARFHVLETSLFWFDAEAQDNNDLHNKKTDHEAEDTTNAVKAEQGDGQEWRKDGCTTPKGVADSGRAQAEGVTQSSYLLPIPPVTGQIIGASEAEPSAISIVL
jgi:hypothetical protein